MTRCRSVLERATTRAHRSPAPVMVCASSTSGIAGEVAADHVVAALAGLLADLQGQERRHRVAERRGGEVRPPAGDHAGRGELVEPGLHGAARDAEPPGGLEHAEPGLGRRTGRSTCGPDRPWSPLRWTSCPGVRRSVAQSVACRQARPMTLTPDELKADLTLEQLKQLVGLVEYDAENDPFPVTGWDAVVFVVGNATQTAHFYQLALGHGARGLPRPRERLPRLQVLRAPLGQRPVRLHRWGRPGQPLCSTTTAGTATAWSTSPSRSPTSTSASSTPGRGRDGRPRAPRRDRRARHGPDRRHRDVRRDPPHARRPQPVRRPLPARLRRRGEHLGAARRATPSGSSRPSTTASATSSSVAWTSGSTSTTRSWASRTWRSSSATTSPPTTPR